MVRIGQDGWALIVRATKKLLRLTAPGTAPEGDQGTTLLGPWYATVLFWRPRVALLVNESTLLLVLLLLAPAATLTSRIGRAGHHRAERPSRARRDHRAGTAAHADRSAGMTANRSVVGVMTEFARLAEAHRDADPAMDLVGLAVRLAETPCGPLYGRNVSPDRELAAALQVIAT